MANAKAQIGDKIIYAENQYQALEKADALIIATEWGEFRTPDFDLINKVLNQNKVIFDGKNLFELSRMKKMGFSYTSIGRSRKS